MKLQVGRRQEARFSEWVILVKQRQPPLGPRVLALLHILQLEIPRTRASRPHRSLYREVTPSLSLIASDSLLSSPRARQ